MKELKNRLSEYLARVRRGETITITSRGKPIAELRAPAAREETPDERWDRLVGEGVITPARKPTPRKLSPPVEAPGGVPASQLIIQDRESEDEKFS